VLSPGDQIQADFHRDYRLRPYVTKVKISGVKVGTVTDVDHDVDGATRVSMKLDHDHLSVLRSAPSAAIRPTTLLGGNYYVDLVPGGDPGQPDGVIPVDRTTTPVELDHVLEVLNPEARKSLQRTVRRLDGALGNGGSREVDHLLADAPDTLTPVSQVVSGLRGTRPDTDLTAVVQDLGNAARVLTENRGQLESVLAGLDSTSAVLDRHRLPLAAAVRVLPATLQTARTGLESLGGTLDQLEVTAGKARPVAAQLDDLLAELEPALAEAQPVVRDLRPTLRDLRPVVRQLVPTAATGTQVLHDVDGAPLERVNGPVMDAVLSPWKGTGEYAGGGNSTPLYIELGNMLAGLNNVGRMTDRNGATINFQPGFGIGSVSGTPISFERLVNRLIAPGGER
jgi:phospholipid/cholesterol/gamma-HCH transport system substrate-binding protein